MSSVAQGLELPEWLPQLPLVEAPPVREHAPAGELRVAVLATRFAEAAAAMKDAGARFVTIFAGDEPGVDFTAIFALRGALLLLNARASGTGTVPPPEIGSFWPAARWAEQELLERIGLRSTELASPQAELLRRELDGLDVFSIPYGPVRSGVFEAIQFEVETGGEDVTRLHTKPFFKRRGLEARLKGMAPEAAVGVAERIAGIASCAYASAFSMAVERALGVSLPPQAGRWRVLYAELERIACHLDVIAKEAETGALSVGLARFQILKEQVMRLRAGLSGSRFGRGVIVPGGVRLRGAIALDGLLEELSELEREVRRDKRLFLGTASMIDRLIGAGRLRRELVEAYGAVGPVARGSGVSTDARHERPYGAYERLGLRVSTRPEGDAMARIYVRFGEIGESLRVLRQCVDHLRRREGPLCAELPTGGSGAACGWAEAPAGELVVAVELRDGVLAGVHFASPSLRNWAVFDEAFPKDVLTDFAFIEHSFGLTPAGADR